LHNFLQVFVHIFPTIWNKDIAKNYEKLNITTKRLFLKPKAGIAILVTPKAAGV